MTERKYLPTIAELIDRLSIVAMKQIFIDKNYKDEAYTIIHDLDLFLADNPIKAGGIIYAILILFLANRYIWENEASVRAGVLQKDKEQLLKQLLATHSINGVRNKAKNTIAINFDERVDLKVDCLAADLMSDMSNWDVFK